MEFLMAESLTGHGELALNLDYVCRSMDLLDDGRIKAIRRRSLEVAKTLLPEPLTAIFYDTTSLYFESDREDGLRLKGYSKDGKPHRVQVVFALLVTPEGLPVGAEAQDPRPGRLRSMGPGRMCAVDRQLPVHRGRRAQAGRHPFAEARPQGRPRTGAPDREAARQAGER